MACILRVSGRRFKVDDYLRRSPFMPVKVYKRGARQFPGSKKLLGIHSSSGCNIVVSPRERTDYRGQVRDTVRFLNAKMKEVRRLRRFAGVDWAMLDFGAEWHPDAALHYSHLPENLVALAAKAGLALEVSVYPSTPRVRRKSRKRA